MIQALNEFAESQHTLTAQEIGSQGASSQFVNPRYPQSLPGEMPFVDQNLSLIGSAQKNQTMQDSELRYATDNLNSPQSPDQDDSYGEDECFEDEMPGKEGVISEHAIGIEGSLSSSEAQSSAATPNTVNQCREKTKQIGGLLLALSGHPVPPNFGKGNYTPTTSKQKKAHQRQYYAHSGSKENQVRNKKNLGSSITSSKSKKLPVLMNDSSSIDREEVQVIGRMEDTIKAYFPAKSQVKRFKHNIKKLRSTSVVTQRLLPAHCQSQAVFNQNTPQSPGRTNAYSNLEDTDFTGSHEKQKGYYRMMDLPPRRSTKHAAMIIAQQNMYVPLPNGVREGRTLNQERASNLLKELPPLKRQSSQGGSKRKHKAMREGSNTLAQAGRLQISSNKLYSLKPATSTTKFPHSLKSGEGDEPKKMKTSAGSALNACRAQSGRRIQRMIQSQSSNTTSPLPGSGQEPRVLMMTHSSEKQVNPRIMPAGSGATDEEDGQITERGRSSPNTPPTASETATGSVAGKLEVVKEKPAQTRKDFEKRNLQHLKAIMEKKKQEVQMIEEERQKMKETREKLKKMILQRADRRKKEKQELQLSKMESLEESKGSPHKRKSRFQMSPSERGQLEELEKTQEEKEEEERQKRLELQKLKKYYRSRYATMLQMIKENQKSKKEKEQKEQEQKQRNREILKEKIGVSSVQSRFMNIETEKKKEEAVMARHQSMPPSNTRRAKTFYKPREMDDRREKSLSPMQSKAKVTELRAKDDTDLPVIKESAKKEQQERLLKKQQQFLEELQKKKLKEKQEKQEEEKRKEKMRSQVREIVKHQNAHEIQKRQKSKKEVELEQEQKRRKEEQEQRKKEAKEMKKAAEANQNFLERNMVIKRPINKINITDIAIWKKRNKVEEHQKVFHVSGGYAELKRALKERKWVENKEMDSICFDLMWTLKAKDIPHKDLLPHQLVNHFEKNTAITTKVGLCHNLKNLIWFENVDIDEFYPRCFDLIEGGELDDFIEQFKVVKAESILKLYYMQKKRQLQHKAVVEQKITEIDDNKVQVALSICERRLMDLDDLIDDPTAEHVTLITPAEWEILSTDEKTAYDIALQKHQNFLAKINAKYGRKKKSKKKKKGKSGNFSFSLQQMDESLFFNAEDGQQGNEEIKLFERVGTCLEEMKSKFPQFLLNGVRNMWMLKPAGLSRGRGIQVFNSLNQILSYTKNKEQQWVIQKYMENSLIIHDRKFDIRQWVLVTDWNPLTIWFYNEAYMRFSAKKYDPNVLGNKYIHLCNNSINKNSKGTDYDHDQEIGEGLMWDNASYQEWMEQHFGFDIWAEQLQPQLKDIVIHSLKSVQNMVENRKNSFQMFGYDFMVDEQGNPWLIEVNSSPAMDYSTEITERMVKECLRDTAKVVVDYHFASNKKKAHVDTGQYELIYKSKRQVDKPMNAFGLNLVVEGKRIRP